MMQRIRRFAADLHEDESGPNTVEWVLLIIIGLIILLIIFWFANWVIDQFKDKAEAVQDDAFLDQSAP